ncbi:MAG TPA: hypothetical protein VIL42_03415 [Sphingomicrobium sp.]|jgi:hypothetical protein
MKLPLCLAAIAAAASASPAFACAPPPPGWVPPTHEQLIERFTKQADHIVYGIIAPSAAGDRKSMLKVLHVYKGGLRKGYTIEGTASFDLPVPHCSGMMMPPDEKPVGTYGVFALRGDSPELNMIKPEDVQLMIRKGWIRSAQAL